MVLDPGQRLSPVHQCPAAKMKYRRPFPGRGEPLPMFINKGLNSDVMFGHSYIIKSTYIYREKVLKWNGWGYKDSGFRFNDKNVAEFIGKR